MQSNPARIEFVVMERIACARATAGFDFPPAAAEKTAMRGGHCALNKNLAAVGTVEQNANITVLEKSVPPLQTKNLFDLNARQRGNLMPWNAIVCTIHVVNERPGTAVEFTRASVLHSSL